MGKTSKISFIAIRERKSYTRNASNVISINAARLGKGTTTSTAVNTARTQLNAIKLKDRLRVQMLEYLSSRSCAHCGIADIRVLDFDHIDPATKSFSIARAIANVSSWQKILAEIQKCQILCANCHKIKTAAEQKWYRNVA